MKLFKQQWWSIFIVGAMVISMFAGCAGDRKEVQNYGDDTIVNQRGNSVGNIVNNGLVAKQGNWIYYISKGSLHKIRPDGTERTFLNKVTPGYLNVVGDWIYYGEMSGSFSLYKIRTDGSKRTDRKSVV